MGRRKIKMEIVKDAASRLVTFSKRRNGIFKKANELAILCGAELAIVVFSPGGKPFSFGHPSVDAVTQRFLRHLQDEEAKSPAGGTSSSSGSKKARRKAEKLNKRLMNLTEELEEEKKKGSIRDKVIEEKKQEYGLGLGPGPEIEAIAGESEGRGETEEERNGGSSVFTGTCRETGSEKLNLAVFIEKSSLEGSRKWRFQRPILEARCTKGKFFS